MIVPCTSQNLTNSVNYKDIKFKLPETWKNKTQEIEKDFIYQITSWDENGNSFVFQWIETKVDLDDYLNVMKESSREMPIYKDAVFGENKTGSFRDMKTAYFTFHMTFMGVKYMGKIFTFGNEKKTFSIMYQGEDKFYKSRLDEKIIESLEIGSLPYTPKKSEQPKTTKWTLYEIENIGQIAIPPTLELRDENSAFALSADIIMDHVYTYKKIDITKLVSPKLTFQPYGTDNLDKTALSKYARVLISYMQGKEGDFCKWNEKFSFPASELKEMEGYIKEHTIKQITVLGNVKLIKWYPVEFTTINRLACIKISFTRQMDNDPVVKVEQYKFCNSSESIEITISYRLSESDIWASDFSKIAGTFDFSSKK
jgi:hypothetical protein